MGSRASPQARLLFKDAFDKLEQTVSANHPVDARNFHSMTLQDVCAAAKQIEQELGARQCLRNMRRIEPFFAGLERYSKVVEILCNGTAYLPWIWAPVKLVLQLASDFTVAIEKLISAYGRIAEVLPRFDRLSAAFQDDANFQRVVATVYADILDFHREAYEFFRKQGWKIFFKSLWSGFDRRFKGILDSLARHSELVDKEANSIDIAEAKEWRNKLIEDTENREQERAVTQFHAALSWLEVKDYEQREQEDELDRQYNFHHAHSCDWVLKNPKARSWMRLGKDELVLWLNGKPGAGKSVLSSMIIRFLQQDTHSIVLYYFCNYYSSSSSKSSHILRSLTAQLLRCNKDLSGYVYDEHICQGLTSSVPQLKKLIPKLLSSIPSVRIVVDGLDEFEQKDQNQILNDVIPFATASDTGAVCKVLIASRDINPISRHLSKRSTVSLTRERAVIDAAIQSFVKHSLVDIRRNLSDMNIDDSIMTKVEQDLIKKADGMFLWVRLVLCTLENVHSFQQLCDAVGELPKGLEKIYDRVLCHIRQQMDAQDREKVARILEWIALAKRPMKKFELLDGVSLHRDNSQLNERTRLWGQVIDLCKPLVEDGPNETIVFIHFTVREYLLRASDNAFVRPVDAHHDISFACIAYLRTGFDLIDPDLAKEQKMVRVGKGFHALQLYAYEHWVAHLFAYANLNGGLEGVASQPLMEQLAGLYEAHEHMKSQLFGTPNPGVESQATGDDIQDLHYLSNMEASKIVLATLRLRKLLKNGQQNAGKDVADYEMAQDSTLFTKVLHSYKEIVHHLLKAKEVPGLDREQLARFKQHYESSAFVCRFRGCPRATNGYSTEPERKDHETLQHAGGIKCSEMDCSFHRIGFKSSAALKRHMQNFHPTAESLKKPSVVRRKYICGEPAELASNGVSWGCGQRFALESELQRHFESAAGKICLSAKSNSIHYDDLPGVPELQHPQGPPIDKVLEKSVQDVGNSLMDLNIDDVPSEYKNIGVDWHAVSNPNMSRILDVDLVKTLPHDSVVCCVRFSHDGKYIATGCNRSAQIFDVSSGIRVTYLQDDSVDKDGDLYIRSICFSPNGKYLATGAEDNLVRVWDIKSRAIRQIFSGHNQDIYSLDFASNGHIIVSGSGDRTVRFWDLDCGMNVMNLAIEDGVTTVAISPDGRLVAAGSQDKSVRVWDINNGYSIKKYEGHNDSVYSVFFAPNGRDLVSGSLDKTLKMWELTPPRGGLSDSESKGSGCVKTFEGHKDFVVAVTLTPDGQWILSGSKDRCVQFWDPQSGNAQLMLQGHRNTVISVAASPGGRLFATGSGDMTARIWSYALR